VAARRCATHFFRKIDFFLRPECRVLLWRLLRQHGRDRSPQRSGEWDENEPANAGRRNAGSWSCHSPAILADRSERRSLPAPDHWRLPRPQHWPGCPQGGWPERTLLGLRIRQHEPVSLTRLWVSCHIVHRTRIDCRSRHLGRRSGGGIHLVRRCRAIRPRWQSERNRSDKTLGLTGKGSRNGGRSQAGRYRDRTHQGSDP